LTVFDCFWGMVHCTNRQKHSKTLVYQWRYYLPSGQKYRCRPPPEDNFWKQTSCGPSGLIWNYRGISFLYNFTNYERMAGNKYIIEHVKTKFTTQIFIYKLQSNTRW